MSVEHINRPSHGTTGFVATLVLTCAFAVMATALWKPSPDLTAQDAAIAVPSAVAISGAPSAIR
jgi:hypothetical protein